MATASRDPGALGRRGLLTRLLGVLAALPMAGVLVAMVRQKQRGIAPRRVHVAPDFRDDVAFGDGVIVARVSSTRVAVFSSSCTHLGCRISRVEDGLLVCPCHGSRFHRDGSVASGPATRPLAELPFTTDATTGAFVIDVA
jgi:nitrite reductase/ring-hydroxylating ferredoxin subunit